MSEAALQHEAGLAPSTTEASTWESVAPPTTPTEEVEVGDLRFGLSPREPVFDAEHVRALAGLFNQLPPILVHAPSLRVIDGVHRVLAARALGRPRISAVLFRGSESEASFLAVRCNIAHGKPLTLRERETAATKILHSYVEWSDRRIAAICGLSPKTVGRIRQRTCDDSPQLARRVGRDGRLRPVDPAEVRQSIVTAIRSDPEASTREIAERTGAAQGTVRDVRSRLQAGQQPPRTLERPPRPLKDDEAFQASLAAATFVEWFDQHLVESDDNWQEFVPVVPIGRVYEVADAARQCAESWRRLAAAVEARAGRRRKTRPDQQESQ